MADKKYQVFISSTFRDLKNERLDIARSVLDIGHFPAAMEYFPAIDEEQLRYIKRTIDQCDYYVLIIAGKYGSVDSEGVSYTEREYDYAVEQGKFVLGFPYKDITKLPREQTEDEPATIARLDDFRKKVMRGRLVRLWDDRRDLDLQVTKALASAFSEYPQPGWVRTPKDSNEELLSEINTLRKDNAVLSAQVSALGRRSSIEDIAHLDENFSLQISFKTFSGRYARDISITWEALFLVLGQVLKGTQTRSNISVNVSAQLAKGLTREAFSSSHIREEHLETMLLQFTALGLLNTNDRQLFALSKVGNSKYTALAVVKTARP